MAGEVYDINAAEIRKAREARGLSQKQLSQLVGVSEDAIAGWESGRHKRGRRGNVQKAANVLHVPVERITIQLTSDTRPPSASDPPELYPGGERYKYDGDGTPTSGEESRSAEPRGPSGSANAANGPAARTRLNWAFGHPHGALVNELLQSAESITSRRREFVAPPGFLKTVVLRDLSDRTDHRQRGVFVLDAFGGSKEEFWNRMMERIYTRFPQPRLDWKNAYDVVKTILPGDSLVLVDNADLFVRNLGADGDGRLWLAELCRLDCHVVITGIIRAEAAVVIAGGERSEHFPSPALAPVCTDWTQWSKDIARHFGVEAHADRERVEAACCGHPVIYMVGMEALGKYGASFALDEIARQHGETVERILRRLPENLAHELRVNDGANLDEYSLEVLREGRILDATSAAGIERTIKWQQYSKAAGR